MNQRKLVLTAAAASFILPCAKSAAGGTEKRPNILFCLADDWSWPHSTVYGDKVVQTPTCERVAKQGVLFNNAFCSSPSCSPSRAAILTGRNFCELEDAANLWGFFPKTLTTYTQLLESNGYHVGFTRKGWGPGNFEESGWSHNPAGKEYENFTRFLDERPAGAPFCFWFGSHDPHRPYKEGSGKQGGIDPAKIEVPPYMIDDEVVRSDLADYYWLVQRFDREVGMLLNLLEKRGELSNTLVVISSDNGMPFPRAKANIYDSGAHVPLLIMWPGRIPGNRTVDDLVVLPDLAPTFLEAAGMTPASAMTARSLMPVLLSKKSGQVDSGRDAAFFGRERHTLSQPDGWGGYPMRAVRTQNYLYIRNFHPERWPAGTRYNDNPQDGNNFSDLDNSPTKTRYMEKRDDADPAKPYLDRAFGKRPAEELYDLEKDPYQLNNIAGNIEYKEALAQMRGRLESRMNQISDPRISGEPDRTETYRWYPGNKHPVMQKNWMEAH